MLRRKQTDSTKEKISQAAKDIWAHRSDAEKEAIRSKQSETMKQNWQRVPMTTIDDIVAEEEKYNPPKNGRIQPARIKP